MIRITAIRGRLPLLVLGAAVATACLRAQITVEGVQDRQVVAGQVVLRIPVTAGYTYTCDLNGAPLNAGAWVTVNQPDFYELQVRRAATASGAVESLVVRFIVKAGERGDTEWGLPPWTPYPVVNSSVEELTGARVRLLAPAVFPRGIEIPVAAFLETDAGSPVRANGLLSAEGHAPIQLRRGVGSGFLASTHPPGLLRYAARLSGIEADHIVAVETNTIWTSASGTLSGQVDWPADSRVSVDSTLTIASGATLSVGAGTVVRLGPGVDVVINGHLVVRGSRESPVVFTPQTRAQPWGGFICRTSASQIDATGAMFVGSGANPRWFAENSGYDVHLRDQALFLLDGARATLTDCALLDGHGQAGHGKNASFSLTRCLVQRFVTTGEYNGGSVQISGCALIEFPADDAVFADADNDAIYFTTGHHEIRDSLVGWAKDDGIDAGSGGAGSVTVSNCWVEACFHEAFAWSGGGRTITNLHCVSMNCGQGIEAGWSSTADSPNVFADHCLSLGNLIGARFGDNYDWTYNGFLRVTNSLVLFNYRDIWGMNWDDWTYRTNQMDLRGNLVSQVNPNHPDNRLWLPTEDAWRLASFMSTPPGAAVGLGMAARSAVGDLASLPAGLPIGLSSFTTHSVSVEYLVDTGARTLASGTLVFTPGEALKRLALPPPPADSEVVRVVLSNPLGAALTGLTRYYFLRQPATPALIPTGSTWRYRDDGSDQGVAWRRPDFSDDTWKSGPAELGFGDGDEATVINGGPSSARIATVYFRRRFLVGDPAAFTQLRLNLRRDDGAIVYLNGLEVFRSNMPTGEVSYATYTGQATTSETAFFSTNVPPTLLSPGTNLVAVELHQSDRTSSDLSFELELRGVPVPRLGWQRLGSEVFLLPNDPAYGLEAAPSVLGPWQSVAAVPGPIDVPPAGPRFFRLRSR